MSVIYITQWAYVGSMIRVGDQSHQVPTITTLMTKGPCDPISVYSLGNIVKIVAVYLTLWPVKELGLLGMCYSSDLQVQYLM